jgi:hypothetical protein
MPDKIIVTNESALKSKYKAAGLKAVKAAVKKWIAADKNRGLVTAYIPVNSASAMKKVGGKAVTDAASPQQNKAAIDSIFNKLAPDYLCILGAADVIPHQDLKNPMFSPGDDDDKLALGDIPYACEAQYSKNPEDFVGPTRVVGRVPDLDSATDPKYLVDLIQTAANYSQRTPSDYAQYLGITAAVWKGSTALSLENIFGNSSDLQSVPPKTAKWPKTMISRRAHFINCHGADSDFHFYGQSGNSFPESMDASLLKVQISEGTVAAAECCYGGQLYDPANTAGQAGIPSTYLAEKAYGFFGSTTIAYGPADGNGAADLICQFFLLKVISGSSLGRAALEARQEFAQSSPTISPVDLKTLAQFNLLGDPSIHPVSVPTPHAALPQAARKARPGAPADGHLAERGGRRSLLMSRGMWLSANRPVAATARRATPKPAVTKQLEALAQRARMKDVTMLSYSVRKPPEQKRLLTRAMAAKSPGVDTFHVALGTTRGEDAPVPMIKALVAAERAGKIVSVQELFGKTK